MPDPKIVEALIAKQTGDSDWASNYTNFGGNRNQYDKYFKDGKLKEGYSLSGDIGGSEQVFSQKVQGQMVRTKDSRYRKDDTTFEIYKLPEQKAAPAPAPAPAPPSPPPKDKSLAVEPVQHSLEIKKAKERVKSYEDDIRSGKTSEDIYGQAQANVQSSFIKPPSLSNMSQQYDFDSKTFNAIKPTETNEQAQAAQNQLQNYVSKYS